MPTACVKLPKRIVINRRFLQSMLVYPMFGDIFNDQMVEDMSTPYLKAYLSNIIVQPMFKDMFTRLF